MPQRAPHDVTLAEVVLDAVMEAVTVQDRTGALVYANQGAAVLLGFPSVAALLAASAEEILSRFVIFGEDRAPMSLGELPGRVVLQDGVASERLIMFRVLATGEERWARVRASPVRMGGTLRFAVNVFHDVTEQRALADAALLREVQKRRAEDRRALLVQAVAELSSMTDQATALQTVAHLAIPEIGDWSAIDLTGGDGAMTRIAIGPVDADRLDAVVPAVLSSGVPELGVDLIAHPLAARGRTIGVLTVAMSRSQRTYSELDHGFAGALAERVAAAIERADHVREVEDARRATEIERRRLNELIAMAPAAISIHRGPDHVFEMVNERYRQRVHGRDVIGTRFAELGVEDAWRHRMDHVYQTGETISESEFPATTDWRRAAGPETRYFDFSIQPTRDDRGVVDGVVTFSIDVTEQVITRHSLEAARAEAEIANRAKDEFLAILGHELRNPLAPIVTALQLMEMREPESLSRERVIIERQVKHVVRLVDDLLDVSRITRGRIELNKEVIDLSAVVKNALEMSSSLIEHREHQVTQAVPSGLYVEGDPTRLAQIVGNLLNNAAKYMEKGGRIQVVGEREDDKITLTITDQGMGIPPEMLRRIFDVFVQEPQAFDRAQGGLGLGLAIVRSLVQLHGGEVTAHSDGSGRGSEFRVRLPAVLGHIPQDRVTGRLAVSSVTGAGAIRILIVDDNVDAAEVLSEALARLGHRVFVAHDGPSALTLAGTERPDIALLDIGLPVMDGYELAVRLRETAGLEQIKLVAITGYGQASDRERSRDTGFDVHLVKPVGLEVIRQAITQLVAAPRP